MAGELTQRLHRERAKILGGSEGPKLMVRLSASEIQQLKDEHNKPFILSKHDYVVVFDRDRKDGDEFSITVAPNSMTQSRVVISE